jgi:flagellar motor protein MotB
MRNPLLIIGLLAALAPVSIAAKAPMNHYNDGVSLYNAGRYSEATDAFETAVKRKDRPQEAQKFIDRIRKEAVERIRNRALTGVSKTTWQTKYYFIRAIGGRVRVGISSQEMFERQSLNFRQGAVDALMQLSDVLQQNDNAPIDIELISEINQDVQPDPDLLSRQLSLLFSFLSLSSQNLLPNF